MELGTCIKRTTCDNKRFNIVVPTYNHKHKLEVIINCFLSQTVSDWMLTIVSDGPPDIEYNTIIERYSDIDNISFHYLHKRYNDWGHTPREYGLYQGDSEWTVMTGYDNYYVPTFIEEFSRVSQNIDNCEFIFCDLIHNHLRDGISYNKYMDSKLEVDHIDIGNFATKTSTLREVGFPFRSFAADWELVKVLKSVISEKGGNIVKLNQTLYVHN
jgi:glycosyltransferase involved in cell wall biosynthesis